MFEYQNKQTHKCSTNQDYKTLYQNERAKNEKLFLENKILKLELEKLQGQLQGTTPHPTQPAVLTKE